MAGFLQALFLAYAQTYAVFLHIRTLSVSHSPVRIWTLDPEQHSYRKGPFYVSRKTNHYTHIWRQEGIFQAFRKACLKKKSVSDILLF